MKDSVLIDNYHIYSANLHLLVQLYNTELAERARASVPSRKGGSCRQLSLVQTLYNICVHSQGDALSRQHVSRNLLPRPSTEVDFSEGFSTHR